jgi:AraC family transcriptional regulator, positive regulator of tynA and feaB
MSLSFSTKLVPVADRIDAWEWNARQFCGGCRFSFPNRRAFRGSIETWSVGGLELSRFSSSSLSFAKFPIESRHPENMFCTVITQLEGTRSYTQNGTGIILNSGDATLIDSAFPWSSDGPGSGVRLYLHVPRWVMEDRLRTTTIPMAPRISGISTLGATLFHLANSLYREANELSQQEGTAIVEAYFDILSACVGRREPDRDANLPTSSELWVRIENFIAEHLAQPTLRPAQIAAAAGISVRHLHRLFARRGRTVGDWIRERRLEQCRNDLTDPRLRDRTITDIAFHWGFSESAHFSRSFKQLFGICPRVFRSQTWTGLRNEEQAAQRLQGILTANVRHSQPN